MKLVEDVASRAKRIAGTVNESVEKFLYRAEGGEAALGMSVAKIDVSAVTMFTELWLLDTYAHKALNKKEGRYINEVWNNLDGTRGIQYSTSVSLPDGLQDRLFESWITFEERVEADGRRTYIIAICPLEEYKGTNHEVDGAKKMREATSRGVHIVKELTENTCEWTRVQQQVDLKITALPATVLDITARQHLGWANEYQERFRRNWKEVDREGVAALAKVIK